MSLGIGACEAFRKSLSSCAKMWFLTIIADHKDVHVLLFSRGLKPRTPCPVIWVCVIKSLGWNMGQYRAPLLVKYNNMPMAEYKFKYS